VSAPQAEKRVTLTFICWIKKPGTETRCTLSPNHSGEHFHAYTRSTWPRRAGEKQ
jgi:hypothetical protein